jgi:hypothetical protein
MKIAALIASPLFCPNSVSAIAVAFPISSKNAFGLTTVAAKLMRVVHRLRRVRPLDALGICPLIA